MFENIKGLSKEVRKVEEASEMMMVVLFLVEYATMVLNIYRYEIKT